MAADAFAEMMKKLGETGTATKLDQARVSAFYAELSGQLAQARLRARTERESLTRLLGLWGTDIAYRLPPQLPPLPSALDAMGDVEAQALRRRVDLLIARHELAAMARSLRLTEATRYMSLLELGGLGRIETISGQMDSGFGPSLDIEIPIFDTGQARQLAARETYMRAVNRLAERAVNVRSEARAAYESYRATYDIARHYQNRVLPLRQTISGEVLLRYNGMLIDVFELLIDARERIAVNVTALEARRDFLLADAALQTALIAGGDTSASAAAGATSLPAAGAGH